MREIRDRVKGLVVLALLSLVSLGLAVILVASSVVTRASFGLFQQARSGLLNTAERQGVTALASWLLTDAARTSVTAVQLDQVVQVTQQFFPVAVTVHDELAKISCAGCPMPIPYLYQQMGWSPVRASLVVAQAVGRLSPFAVWHARSGKTYPVVAPFQLTLRSSPSHTYWKMNQNQLTLAGEGTMFYDKSRIPLAQTRLALETVDDWGVVSGWTSGEWGTAAPWLTAWWRSGVNVNTASAPVLEALLAWHTDAGVELDRRAVSRYIGGYDWDTPAEEREKQQQFQPMVRLQSNPTAADLIVGRQNTPFSMIDVVQPLGLLPLFPGRIPDGAGGLNAWLVPGVVNLRLYGPMIYTTTSDTFAVTVGGQRRVIRVRDGAPAVLE